MAISAKPLLYRFAQSLSFLLGQLSAPSSFLKPGKVFLNWRLEQEKREITNLAYLEKKLDQWLNFGKKKRRLRMLLMKMNHLKMMLFLQQLACCGATATIGRLSFRRITTYPLSLGKQRPSHRHQNLDYLSDHRFLLSSVKEVSNNRKTIPIMKPGGLNKAPNSFKRAATLRS